MEKRQSLSLRFALVGDPMVGKTSLALAFTRGFFSPENSPDFTQMPETYCKEMKMDDMKILVSVIDTPSLDGYYEALRTSVYTGINCFIICYAIDNPSSLANVENQWLAEIHELCPNAVIILAGTKLDLQATASKSVSESEGAKMAKKYHLDGFVQCSAKSLETVEKVFVDAVKTIKMASSGGNNFLKNTPGS